MSQAFTGVGTQLQVGNGASPEVFTKIEELLTIGGPELSTEQVEVTSLDSTGGYKEYKPGLRDGGQVSFDMNWIASTLQEQVRDDISDGTARNYKIVWPNSPSTSVVFNASVVSVSFNTEPNSAVTASVALQINGAPVWA